jgi:hypothetical protein
MSGLLPALGGSAGLPAVQLVAGGLSGILAMAALIATDVLPARSKPAGAPPVLAIRGCFNTGSVVAVAQAGEQMLITGRSADGAFLRVYVPGPAAREGWIPAGSVDLLADGATLPVAGCAEVAAATGTPGPTANATAVVTPGPTPTATGTPMPTPKANQTAGPTAGATVRPTTKPTTAPTATPPPTPTPTPNVGPVFTSPPTARPTTIASIAAGSTAYCPYARSARIVTAVEDPDGVASVQLWVRKPSTRTYVRLSHDFVASGSTWVGTIDTVKDALPAPGSYAFRAVAVDTKGASTTSASSSITIIRCDTEATFKGGIDTTDPDRIHYNSTYATYYLACDGPFVIPFRYSVVDPDFTSKVTLTYTITSVSHPTSPPLSSTITLRRSFSITKVPSNIWTGATIAPLLGNYRGRSTITWRLTSTDQYKGTTTNPSLLLPRFSAKLDWSTCVD